MVNDRALTERAEIAAREGHRTAAASSAARSTSTPGSTSARPTVLGDLAAAFLSAQLERASDRGAAPRLLERLPRGFAALEQRGVLAAGRPGALRAQRPPLLPAAADGPRAHALRSPAGPPASSPRSSTTCRCTSRPWAGASAASPATARTEDAERAPCRLPLWAGMGEAQIDAVISGVSTRWLPAGAAHEAGPSRESHSVPFAVEFQGRAVAAAREITEDFEVLVDDDGVAGRLDGVARRIVAEPAHEVSIVRFAQLWSLPRDPRRFYSTPPAT